MEILFHRNNSHLWNAYCAQLVCSAFFRFVFHTRFHGCISFDTKITFTLLGLWKYFHIFYTNAYKFIDASDYMQFCANIFYNFVSNTLILTQQNFRNSIIFECRKWNFIASNTGKNTIKIKCKPSQKFIGWTVQTFVDLYLANTNSTMLFLHLTNVSAKFYGEFN